LRRSFADSKWRGEWSCLHKQGATLEIYVRTAVLDLFERKSLIVMWEDITELKKARERLTDSEQRLRAIFESVSDLVYLKDRSLTYMKVNPAFEKMLGKASEDIVGRRYEELFGQEGAAYEKDVDLRVLEGQTIEEERGKEVNGVVRRFHEVRSPLVNGDGDVTGLCAIARDITELRARLAPLPKETRRPRSKTMQATLERALMAAKQRSVVLLRGESGSGKDYLASFIHNHSDRAAGPYYSINCAALTESLAESELFGHERGSFTGAHTRKRGLLELAEGGTLLLNEVADLSPLLQAKLLSFLDTRKLMRVGGQQEIAVNARLMAATNKDLEADVQAGRFRKDLYYRLSVMIIELPPLRTRIEDIPDLAELILHELAEKLGYAHVPELDSETISSFQSYSWPGNVRELKNVLERTLILGRVPPLGTGTTASGDGQGDYSLTLRFGSGTTLRELTDEVTRSLCIEALRRSQGNKKEAAKLLGIARDSLYRHLKHFGLERDIQTP